jgi:hypothetical protein
MIHDLDISKWPNATFTKWAALINQTPTLDWNRKVVNPVKVAALSAKLAASFLPGANAFKSIKP